MKKPRISQARLDRLLFHLEELERQTGRRLRAKPRHWNFSCPIVSFAPDVNSQQAKFGIVTTEGQVKYGWETVLQIYEETDGIWWRKLSVFTKQAINNYIQQWIQERQA